MNWKFSTAEELLARVAESGLGFADYLVARDAFYSGRTQDEVRAEVAHRIRVSRAALDRGAAEPQVSFSGMTKGGAVLLGAATGWPVDDPFFRKALTYALAINEVNACGGRIIAFPTAGSCGIVPGVLWAWRDARATDLGPDSAAFQDAFIAASAVGILIAARATLAGAAGGCQAECGAAGAMAAAGLATLLGEGAATALDAAALSLSRAGIRSVIPFDEVVGAMKSIGDAMPASVRESAEGGLAKTATGMSYWEKIR
jgi:L-serine dehydratase